jgi:hypothetical protein
MRLLIARMAHNMASQWFLTTVLPGNAAVQMKRVLNGQDCFDRER